MRQLILVIVKALLLIGSLIATFGTAQLRDYQLRGYVDASQDQNIPFAMPRPGINVELLQYSESDLRANLQLMQRANFHWLRQFAYWDEIETQPGEFDWSAWDQLATALKDFPQFELVAVLMNSPAWARARRGDSPLTKTAPPQDLQYFASFASAFAARYGAVIDYYQIWDEPNLGEAWGGLEPRPAEYAALLAMTHEAILRADPDALIVAAGLAPTTETAGRNISDIRYLDALYAQGARQWMDVVAGKPYGFSTSPQDRQVDKAALNFSRIIALREVMLAHDDGKKALWASNYGWNALPADWAGPPSIWGAVSEAQRVDYTLGALERAQREWPWLGALFLQHWQPAAAADSPQWGFALRGQDGQPTPLLLALESYQYPTLAQDGLYHARNAHARYSGVWQFSPRGADISWINDSQLEFDFYGSDLALLLNEDDYVAFLYPTVDGQPANATRRDASGNAYVMLRSNSRHPETNLAPIAAGLPLEEHKLHVIADRGWDRWALVGYAVSSGDLAAPYNRQISLGLLSICLSLLVFGEALLGAPWREWLPLLSWLSAGLSATAHLLLTGITSLFMLFAMLWAWDSPRFSFLLRDDTNLLLALLTSGALRLSESVILTALLALFLFLLIAQRLESGLIVTLFWVPFFLFPLSLYSYALPMAEVMILLTAAAGLARGLAALGRRLQMRNSAYPLFSRGALASLKAMDLAVGGLGLLAILSLLWTQNLETALTELRTLIIEPLLFYALLRAARPSRESLLRFFGALALAALLVALYGLYMYFIVGDCILAEGGSCRLLSVYGSPNNVGLLLGRAMPIALAFALVDVGRRLRWLALGSLLIMALTLLLTQSVGALFLGLPAAIVVVLAGHYQRKALAPLIALGFIGGGAFTLLTRLSARFAGVLDFSAGTTSFFRLRLWESALAIIRDHPLTGIGLDQFLYLYRGDYVRPDAIWDSDLSHPHNVILDFWTRLSLFGLGLFLLLQALFWRDLRFLLQRCRTGDAALFAMTLSLAGSVAALLAHGLIDNSVFVIDLAFIFMFQLAALLRLKEIAQENV